jgi:hypothetical protein
LIVATLYERPNAKLQRQKPVDAANCETFQELVDFIKDEMGLPIVDAGLQLQKTEFTNTGPLRQVAVACQICPSLITANPDRLQVAAKGVVNDGKPIVIQTNLEAVELTCNLLML